MTVTFPVLDRLELMVGEMGDLQSTLILLVGNGKTPLLRALADRLHTATLNIGAKLGHRLAVTPISERGFSTSELLREITDCAHGDSPLLLDNLEVLFEPRLSVNPLYLIKQLARSRRVVAAWPGEMHDDHLVYARMGHPEHRDYPRDGTLIFETAQSPQGMT